MIILKTKTDEGVQVFNFTQVVIPGTTEEEAAEASIEAAMKAATYIMKTSAAGFVAEVNSINDTRGKILKAWDHKKRIYGNTYRRELSYNIKYGAYKDHVWAVLGTEENCLEMASQQNKKCQGWYDTSAHVEHLVGSLWQVVYTSPYLD